ncbi:SIR2 family protein [Fusibacter ferrireducens]|uniref:SIR2 family protein n=1 Tax=Fusibacter ferrireducens TaxID=2785058 RepID=A0ABS0A0A9_9FIRM|nr:SIR2 family protein [Fusibacter ferrireducens]MBF4696096.1 SIR2 family protein [Fusibacter ferrireducens]
MKNTVLIGNGLNRCEKSNKSWDDLLISLSSEYGIRINDEIKQNLYTFFYERVVLSSNHNDELRAKEEDIKKKIAIEMGKMVSSDLYVKLHELEIDNYITTNYDYCIENTLKLKKFEKKNSDVSENIYSIRRNIEFENNSGEQRKIWHVHGEIDYPRTIMLGLDHYCGSIGKMDSYVKGNYSFKNNGDDKKTEHILKKLKKEAKYDNFSWIELFFNSNVHIVGFGLDYSETDIWWILNRRARIIKELKMKSENIIYYYGKVDETKANLLKDFEVEYIEVELNGKAYYEQNLKILEEVRKQI